MMGASETLCITCGQPAGEFPRLNHLPSGQVCPTCRNRLLEALPPLLPGGFDAVDEPREAEETPRTETQGPRQTDVVWGQFPPDTPA